MILIVIDDERDAIVLTDKSCLTCAQKKLRCEILSYYSKEDEQRIYLTYSISKREAKDFQRLGVRIYDVSCICK